MTPNRIYIPEISREDYPAFKQLSGSDFTESYDCWLQTFKAQLDLYGKPNYIATPVKVTSDEFGEYCQARSLPCNKSQLSRFAKEKCTASSN